MYSYKYNNLTYPYYNDVCFDNKYCDVKVKNQTAGDKIENEIL